MIHLLSVFGDQSYVELDPPVILETKKTHPNLFRAKSLPSKRGENFHKFQKVIDGWVFYTAKDNTKL
ncbi:MAG: hypothetical protein AMK69_18425 [Nitrospira bacterium SG8_3]|nr:MAG: hypothetical protein AMK69_18425 [Nitrospira bacterium SG8_3]